MQNFKGAGGFHRNPEELDKIRDKAKEREEVKVNYITFLIWVQIIFLK